MRPRPAGRLLVLAFASFLALLAHAPAAAQGTLGLFPDPIALADLRLGISLRHPEPLVGPDAEARWAEVVRAHDRSLAAMRALRDGSIEAALQARWAAEAAGLWADPDALRADLRRRQSVDAEIARLDAALISEIVEARLFLYFISVSPCLRERSSLDRTEISRRHGATEEEPELAADDSGDDRSTSLPLRHLRASVPP